MFSLVRSQRDLSARRPPLAPAAHALAGLPDGAGLVLMDPAEVPNQSEPADALRATTSQLSGRAENGVSRESTVSGPSGILSF